MTDPTVPFVPRRLARVATDALRLSTTYPLGEPTVGMDPNAPQHVGRLFVGDGSTPGGLGVALLSELNALAATVAGQPALTLGDVLRRSAGSGTLSVAWEGDSLTEGSYVSGGTLIGPNSGVKVAKAPPAFLQDALAQILPSVTSTVTNRGWSGHTSVQGLTDWANAPYTDVCFWMYGYNDAQATSPTISVSTFRATLKTWIARKLAAGTLPIVLGAPSPRDGSFAIQVEAYVSAARDVARQFGVMFVDLTQQSEWIVPRFQSDAHPLPPAYCEMGYHLAALFGPAPAGQVRHVSPGSIFFAQDNIGVGGAAFGQADAKSGQLLQLAANASYTLAVYCDQDLFPCIHTYNVSGTSTESFTVHYAEDFLTNAPAIAVATPATASARASRVCNVMPKGYRLLTITAGANGCNIEAIAFYPTAGGIYQGGGWTLFPDGKMLQYGTYVPANGATDATVPFQLPFPIALDNVIVTPQWSNAAVLGSVHVDTKGVNSFAAHGNFIFNGAAPARGLPTFDWQAWGRWRQPTL